MATKKEEIVAIAEAQGYEGDTPSTIAEAVNALGSVIGGGSGGGAGMTIHGTLVYESGNPTVTLDKTRDEIKAYIEAGNCDVFIRLERADDHTVRFLPLDQFSPNSLIYFTSAVSVSEGMDGNRMQLGQLTIYANGAVGYQDREFLL